MTEPEKPSTTDQHPEQTAPTDGDEPKPSQEPRKKPYVKPELVHLGSVADLTLTVGSQPIADSQFGTTKTTP